MIPATTLKITRLFMLALVLFSASCTTVLVQTTGEEGMVEDPTERTAGAVVEDQSIETKVAVNLKKLEPELKKANIAITSHNGVVLLVGQVGSEALKSSATRITSESSTKIKRIHNELEVAGKTSLLSRSNDNWIATKVRTLMLANSSVPSGQIRVITENGAVYLMGIVTQEDAQRAVDLTRNVSGVTRVVKVFEYLD
ncbi:MAG: BON domain-containing protein [Gammaproteobacteria bacterium]|jgi:osmotically-inducible protein OsmY|nr:BON domain-containing protein [Gammaproteobacteria bacterium]